jgi:hypothetical protein
MVPATGRCSAEDESSTAVQIHRRRAGARICFTLVLDPFRGSVPRAMTKYEELQVVCIRRSE